MNKADNEAGSKSIDSLINFETVKVINVAIFRRLCVCVRALVHMCMVYIVCVMVCVCIFYQFI